MTHIEREREAMIQYCRILEPNIDLIICVLIQPNFDMGFDVNQLKTKKIQFFSIETKKIAIVH